MNEIDTLPGQINVIDFLEDFNNKLPVIRGADFMNNGYCPRCNTNLASDLDEYCFHCGQKLDWSKYIELETAVEKITCGEKDE